MVTYQILFLQSFLVFMFNIKFIKGFARCIWLQNQLIYCIDVLCVRYTGKAFSFYWSWISLNISWLSSHNFLICRQVRLVLCCSVCNSFLALKVKVTRRRKSHATGPLILQEDETMGLCFKKELTLCEVQLFPSTSAQQAQPTRQGEGICSQPMGEIPIQFSQCGREGHSWLIL